MIEQIVVVRCEPDGIEDAVNAALKEPPFGTNCREIKYLLESTNLGRFVLAFLHFVKVTYV